MAMLSPVRELWLVRAESTGMIIEKTDNQPIPIRIVYSIFSTLTEAGRQRGGGENGGDDRTGSRDGFPVARAAGHGHDRGRLRDGDGDGGRRRRDLVREEQRVLGSAPAGVPDVARRQRGIGQHDGRCHRDTAGRDAAPRPRGAGLDLPEGHGGGNDPRPRAGELGSGQSGRLPDGRVVDTVPRPASSRAEPRRLRAVRDRGRARDRSGEPAGIAAGRGSDLHRQCRRGLCLRPRRRPGRRRGRRVSGNDHAQREFRRPHAERLYRLHRRPLNQASALRGRPR